MNQTEEDQTIALNCQTDGHTDQKQNAPPPPIIRYEEIKKGEATMYTAYS